MPVRSGLANQGDRAFGVKKAVAGRWTARMWQLIVRRSTRDRRDRRDTVTRDRKGLRAPGWVDERGKGNRTSCFGRREQCVPTDGLSAMSSALARRVLPEGEAEASASDAWRKSVTPERRNPPERTHALRGRRVVCEPCRGDWRNADLSGGQRVPVHRVVLVLER